MPAASGRDRNLRMSRHLWRAGPRSGPTSTCAGSCSGWKMFGLERTLGARLVTYADDLVILELTRFGGHP